MNDLQALSQALSLLDERSAALALRRAGRVHNIIAVCTCHAPADAGHTMTVSAPAEKEFEVVEEGDESNETKRVAKRLVPSGIRYRWHPDPGTWKPDMMPNDLQHQARCPLADTANRRLDAARRLHFAYLVVTDTLTGIIELHRRNGNPYWRFERCFWGLLDNYLSENPTYEAIEFFQENENCWRSKRAPPKVVLMVEKIFLYVRYCIATESEVYPPVFNTDKHWNLGDLWDMLAPWHPKGRTDAGEFVRRLESRPQAD